MQDPKKSPKIAIWAPSHNSVATKACIDNRKKFFTRLRNMVNFGPLAAEIVSLV